MLGHGAFFSSTSIPIWPNVACSIWARLILGAISPVVISKRSFSLSLGMPLSATKLPGFFQVEAVFFQVGVGTPDG